MNLRSLLLGKPPVRRRMLVAGFGALAVGSWAMFAAGQPPGGSRGFDPREMIQRLDENRNGQVDPEEMNGRARFFLDSLARDNNLDLSKPISNDKLREILKARFQGDGSSNSSGSSGNSSNRTASAPAPTKAFGVSTGTTTPKVLGFGAGATTDSWDALRNKYDGRVVEKVEEALKRYDRNQDGLLDAEELKNGRWDSGSPLEHDKNKDGKVSRSELAERYKQRYASGMYDRDRGGPPGYGYGGFSGGPPPSGGYSSSGGSFRGPPPGTTTVVASPSGSSSSRPTSSTPQSSSTSGSSSGSGGGDDRVARYAEGLLKQYDTNKDGVLQRDEWSKMRSESQKADRDGNGLITKEELAAQLADYSKSRSGGSSGSMSSAASSNTSYSYGSRSGGGASTASASRGTVKTYRFLSPLERLPKGLPDWFTRNDADGDGQIAMAEFASSWDDAKAAEFSRWDRNGDGLITPKEAVGSGQ